MNAAELKSSKENTVLLISLPLPFAYQIVLGEMV